MHANLILIKMSASHRKSTQVHPSPGKTKSQVDLTEVFNLRQLASPFGQGLTSSSIEPVNMKLLEINDDTDVDRLVYESEFLSTVGK